MNKRRCSFHGDGLRVHTDVMCAGKPMLEAPRAFSLSPFEGEENVVYFGGFDANGNDSTNRAWIFKAGLSTVIGDA